MSGYNNNSNNSRGRRDDQGYYGSSQGSRGRDDSGRRGDYDRDSRRDNRNHHGQGHNPRHDSRGSDTGYNNRGRDNNQDSGHYGRPDRSRSRDDRGSYDRRGRGRDDRFDNRGGRGRGGGGGRGGWGGRGGGRGGRGGGFGPPRPTEILVKTNYFKLEPLNEQAVEWIQYQVEIRGAFRQPMFDDDKKYKGSEIVVGTKHKEPIDIRSGSELSRRILRKLASDEKLSFASDGSCTAFAPSELFDGKSKDYTVTVKRDCDEDETDADLVQNAHFKVKFTRLASIFPSKNVASNALEGIRQALDIILKSAMITVGMKAFGRSPRAFYFPEDEQHKFMNTQMLQRMMNNEEDFMPILGLYQAVKFCEDGNVYVNTDTVVDFANREFKQASRGRSKEPISLINEQKGTVCGVRINLHEYITDERDRMQIEEKLKNIKINSKYIIAMTPEFEKRMKEKGFNDEEIKRKNIRVRRNKFIKADQEHNSAMITWGADDPDLHSFPERKRVEDGVPPKIYTVASYFKEKYNITLKYPKMPIVFLGNKEWFPMEFLYQNFGKMRGANSQDHKDAVLQYRDINAGTKYVENIRDISAMAEEQSNRLERMGLTISDVLKLYNFRKSSTPVELVAKVLQEPELKFAAYSALLKNGSWGVMKGGQGSKFKKPAEMNSFAVVNLSDNPRMCGQFMTKFLQSAKSHGLQIPDADPEFVLNNVTSQVNYHSPEGVEEAFRSALAMAKDFFLYDTCRNYSQNNVFCKSRVKRQGLRGTAVKKEENIYDCLVYPAAKELKAVGLILSADVAFASHWIVGDDGNREDARLMIKVREKTSLVDPFDFRYDTRSRCHLALGENGNWERVTFERRLFQVGENSNNFLSENQVESIPKYMLNGRKIDLHLEAPSIVFVILPNEKVDDYGVVKMLSHFMFGVQTQCITINKFQEQRNDRSKDLFCSNVAIKVNAKLSSMTNKAHAWSTHHNAVEGIPWISEDAPTFVMGLSSSSTLGQSAVSIISASCCLDKSCMRLAQDFKIQSKTEIIDDSILIDLTKGLLIQFYLHNDKKLPERILVYRDGVSDGSFTKVQNREIHSVRQAFLRFKQEMTGQASGDCVLLGCPPITFVVCMTQNKTKIVPANGPLNIGGKDNVNVNSGTCVDYQIMDKPTVCVTPGKENAEKLPHMIYSEPDGKGYDFLLVAHGGIKGTSKTVHYRTILNENAVFRPSSTNTTSLTKSALELLTYQMSFQYSTASKAVRVVPVVHYSSRLSELAMKYYAYLRGTKGNKGEQLQYQPLEDSDEGDLPLDRNGSPRARNKYYRGDYDKNTNLPDHLRSSMLPHFAAFIERNVDDSGNEQYLSGQYQAPFFTHIAA